jgi:hypothetical protein
MRIGASGLTSRLACFSAVLTIDDHLGCCSVLLVERVAHHTSVRARVARPQVGQPEKRIVGQRLDGQPRGRLSGVRRRPVAICGSRQQFALLKPGELEPVLFAARMRQTAAQHQCGALIILDGLLRPLNQLWRPDNSVQTAKLLLLLVATGNGTPHSGARSSLVLVGRRGKPALAMAPD